MERYLEIFDLLKEKENKCLYAKEDNNYLIDYNNKEITKKLEEMQEVTSSLNDIIVKRLNRNYLKDDLKLTKLVACAVIILMSFLTLLVNGVILKIIILLLLSTFSIYTSVNIKDLKNKIKEINLDKLQRQEDYYNKKVKEKQKEIDKLREEKNSLYFKDVLIDYEYSIYKNMEERFESLFNQNEEKKELNDEVDLKEEGVLKLTRIIGGKNER